VIRSGLPWWVYVLAVAIVLSVWMGSRIIKPFKPF
jgi:hypothetical protein